MSTSRRTILAGLASLGATSALPAWAQFEGAIRPQTDPWAQVDPYANERGGLPPFGAAGEPPYSAASKGNKGGESNPPPQPPSPQELAARTLQQALTDPEKYEIINAQQGYYYSLVVRPDLGQGPVLQNQAAQNALLKFSAPFFAASDRPHLPWQILITDTEDLNGCAFGGGKIAVTSALIAHADHPAELAAVIAHEIGHVDFRHSAMRGEVGALMTLSKNKMPSQQGNEFTPEMVDALMGEFREVLVTGFRRENELEADGHVVTMCNRLGMDPGRQIVMWDKMIKRFGIDQTKKTCLMDVHPVMEDRKRALRAKMGGNGNSRAQYVPPGWEELKRYFPTPSGYRWG